MARRGAFIVIEGLDGSGKTTQTKHLVNNLKKEYNVVYTAEPSRGEIGAFIRRRILYRKTRPPISAEALLFAADRIEHLQNEVVPLLEKGAIVVSDRYIYSSLAYQGSAGVDLDWIQIINAQALKPDLALFIDVDPEIVLKRLTRKKSIMENLQTQQKVRGVYLTFVKDGLLKQIEGDKPKKVVAETILQTVLAFLKNRP